MNIFTMLKFTGAVVCFYLFLFMIFSNWKNEQNWNSALLFGMLALWNFADFLHSVRGDDWIGILYGITTYFIPALMLNFAIIFPFKAKIMAQTWKRLLLFVPPIVAILLREVIFDTPSTTQYFIMKGRVTIILAVLIFAYFVSALWILWSKLHRVTSDILRSQIYTIGAGITIFILATFATEFMLPLLFDYKRSNLGGLWSIVFALTVLVSIVKHQMFGRKAVMRSVVSYLLLAIFYGGLFAFGKFMQLHYVGQSDQWDYMDGMWIVTTVITLPLAHEIAERLVQLIWPSLRWETCTPKQAFIIYRDGRLMVEVGSQKGKSDSDIMASMLTAVESFCRDSFGKSDRDSLKRLRYGSSSMMLEHGRFISAAVLHEGEETPYFRDQVKKIVAELEKKHTDDLKGWNGDIVPFKSDSKRIKKLLFN